MTASRVDGCEVTPEYWDDACKHLSKRDRVMRKLIPAVR
jgi:DNA-3-methyladenine glycosylase II